jgi:hypothetical protein
MRELYYIYSTMMSPGNQGVFQLVGRITFRRILVFYSTGKWGFFGGICTQLSAPLFRWWNWSERFQSSPLNWPVRSLKHNHLKNRYQLIIQRFPLTGR